PGGLHGPRLRHVPSCRRVRRRTGAAGPIWQASKASRWPKSSDGRSLHSTIDPRSRFSSSAKLSAGHAHVSRASQRRADSAINRLHQIARFGRKDADAMSTAVAEVPVETRVHYLNASYGIKSWLFTTDHKRIALLYLASITLMFFIGGAAAVMMRLHLIEPAGALVQPETYNKLFTMHGVIMVFFFLVPYIPAEQVQARERQVTRAAHQRHDKGAQRGGDGRNEKEEEHDHDVHGVELVVRFRLYQSTGRLDQMQPHHDRGGAPNEKHQRNRAEI